MEKAYFALRDRLGPSGRRKLLTMQRSWLAYRAKMLVETNIVEETRTHTYFLENTPADMVPFKRKIKLGKLDRSIKGYSFPTQLTRVQKTFNQLLKKSLKPSIGDPDNEGEEKIDASNISRKDKFILSSRIYTDGFYGGAHPLHNATHININVQTGKVLKISYLFSKIIRKKLAIACAVQLAESRSAYEKDSPIATYLAYEQDYPKTIINHVNKTSRWQFEKTTTNISFDEYAIAPYVAGEQQCVFNNTFLAPISIHPEVFQ